MDGRLNLRWTSPVKVLVTILAYNEEANIVSVYEDVKRAVPQAHVVVINDGSRDHTSQVAREAGALVVDLPYNLGIGGAMQTGLKMALMSGCQYVVRMDGDGQHPAQEIPRLLAPVMAGEVDIAAGTRFQAAGRRTNIPLVRRIGIALFSFLATRFAGRKVTDATCSFQALNMRAAAFLDRNMEQDHPEVDGWILLGRAGFRVAEIPIQACPRQKGVSSIDQWRAIYFVVKVTLAAFAAHSRKLQ